jgi:hypothetical protein
VEDLSDTDSLLFANEAFYRAFADRDVEAMADIWSREHPVSCLHPGWGPLSDRSEVISSWAAILSSPEAPDIACLSPRARICGDVGIVICFERLRDGLLVATNMFVREGSLWKMVHHQGGPTSADAPADEAPAGGAVH